VPLTWWTRCAISTAEDKDGSEGIASRRQGPRFALGLNGNHSAYGSGGLKFRVIDGITRSRRVFDENEVKDAFVAEGEGAGRRRAK